MRTDEATLIKCYDSAENGTALFTAHSAVDDPTAPAEVLPRESIELRTLVFHDGRRQLATKEPAAPLTGPL
jgi:hypothetical protein